MSKISIVFNSLEGIILPDLTKIIFEFWASKTLLYSQFLTSCFDNDINEVKFIEKIFESLQKSGEEIYQNVEYKTSNREIHLQTPYCPNIILVCEKLFTLGHFELYDHLSEKHNINLGKIHNSIDFNLLLPNINYSKEHLRRYFKGWNFDADPDILITRILKNDVYLG